MQSDTTFTQANKTQAVWNHRVKLKKH